MSDDINKPIYFQISQQIAVMPRLPPKVSYKVMRFALHGCTNRPFFHIVLTRSTKPRDAPPIEQLGSFDPMPNIHNEKVVSLDIERIKFHLAKGVQMSKPLEKLLGKCSAVRGVFSLIFVFVVFLFVMVIV